MQNFITTSTLKVLLEPRLFHKESKALNVSKKVLQNLRNKMEFLTKNNKILREKVYV